MLIRLQYLGVAFFMAFAISGQASGVGGEDAAGIEFFEKHIRPLLSARCTKCHGAKKQESELRLDSYAALLAGGVSGPAVVPTKPSGSLLMTAVSYDDPDLRMPPDAKLSAAEIGNLRRWVEMGAPHPERGRSRPPTNPHIPGADAPPIWSFQKRRRLRPPQTNNAAWPRNTVDRFVLAALERSGLAPAPAADARTLIRRTTFDLTGLPPTVQEVRDFEKEWAGDPDMALRQLVDRLLASPHYGEKWGRHWLDVARYADSNGLDENVAHGNAWRYRDYVIDAFNKDKPYDQFVLEQLAGDLLSTEDPRLRNERLIATGFLSLGPKVLAEVDERKMEMDIVDEQIDTFGKAFLGLTFGCARCHDHKFDPITMKDYYGLAGIFKSTRTMEHFTKIARWQENPLWSAEYDQQRKEFDRQLHAAKQSVDELAASANSELRERLGAAAQFPSNPEMSYPPATRDELKRLRDEVARIEKTAPQPPTAMGAQEGDVANVAVHLRGSHLTLGEVVPRHLPTALAGETEIAGRQSGRLELARWLTSADHPLTARVMVNRIWRWHFGRGLVATPNNFGRLGERPENQPLLDWLAHEFIQSGWSVKSMHRLILLSATYRMSSRPDRHAARVDPENRLLWRMEPRRLEAEEIRDALLAVSGTLDRTLGGSLLGVANRKHVFDHTSKDQTDYGSRRRSVYLPVIRNHLHDAFALFDYTDASMPNGSRSTSTVAPQALYIMNSDFVADAARALAERLASTCAKDRGRAARLFELAYARPATERETERVLQYLGAARNKLVDEGVGLHDASRQAWHTVCHAVLSANEFFYLQ